MHCTRQRWWALGARTFKNMALVALAALVAIPGPGCSGFVDEQEGDVPITEIPLELRETIKLHQGYLDGKAAEFYRFGTFVPADAGWFPSYEKFPGMPVHPIYIWAGDNGKPTLQTEQHPIIDTLPLQAKYTDFFEVVVVTPDAGEQPNDIKSRGTLLLAGYALARTGHIINCPVVGPEAKLASSKNKLRNTYKKIQVWYRKKITHCMLMEGGSVLIAGGAPSPKVFKQKISDARTEYRVADTEVYTLVSSAFSGADVVSSIPVPNNDVYRYGPGTKDYSPLGRVHDVTVPSDYKVGQVASHAHLYPVPDFTDPRIVERTPAAFHNSSIVYVGK